MKTLNVDSLAQICDHTFLTPVEAYRGKGNCLELRRADFSLFLGGVKSLPAMPYSICVPGADVPHVKLFLEENQLDLKIVSIAGFPDGSWVSTDQKVVEAITVMSLGANEVDMVLDWRSLKEGNETRVLEDLLHVSGATHDEGGLLKVILETGALTDDEIKKSCELCEKAGVDFVKSTTGFGPCGAKPEALRLMAENFSRGIKISGGVNRENVEELVAATGLLAPFDPLKLRIGESGLLAAF